MVRQACSIRWLQLGVVVTPWLNLVLDTDFLQTVMFTLFGNFEPKEEHMLLSVFQHAFKLEFAAAKDINSVMRNNSAMSRMITTYTRRGLGQQYLKDVLARQVGDVFRVPRSTCAARIKRLFSTLACL